MIEIRDYCMARLTEQQLKDGTYELSEDENEKKDDNTSSMLERMQHRELTRRNEARRERRETAIASRWKALLLKSTPFEKPYLHNASLVGLLSQNEPIFVYVTFCHPGKQYFVVNYSQETEEIKRPGFFIDKIIVQPRMENIPTMIKPRVLKAVPRTFNF